mgnify:CR=1 FL=1
MHSTLLAFDIGTSGLKASLVDENLNIIRNVTTSYPTHHYPNGGCEQEAADWWMSAVRAMMMLRELAPEYVKRVDAIGVSGHMLGLLPMDREGQVLRPAMIRRDTRAKAVTETLLDRFGADYFYRISGNVLTPNLTLSKAVWLHENEPEVYAKTYKMLNCKDYIILRLTGKMATEFSDAGGTAILDINKLEWSDEILDAAGIEKDKMPELLPSTHMIGGVTKEAAAQCGLLEGTPVVMGGGDGCCAAVGAASIDVGGAYCCIGSSSWVMFNDTKPVFDENMLTFNWPSLVPGLISPCGTMQAAGVSYAWMRENICTKEIADAKATGRSVYDLINEQIAQAEPGCNGLIYLPYIMGERSPRWNPNAKGAFIGIKTEHTRKELLRSVMEGVTMNLNVIYKIFSKNFKFDEILLIGGGAKSPVWMQMLADVFGINVMKPNYIEEATSMGAAITAGVGVGLFEDFHAIHKFLKVEETIKPNMKNHERYEQVMPVFNQAYFALLDVYESLAKL